MARFTTPRELQLEQENEALRRELRYRGMMEPMPRYGDMPTLETSINYRMDRITLPVMGEVSVDKDIGGIAVTARWHGEDGFGLQYFCDPMEIKHTADRASLLTHLHERVIRQMAEFLFKSDAKVQ